MISIWQDARNQLQMTQEELASSLHTTAVTVSRWENGRSIPNKSMQSALYRYCKERGISLYASILQRIKAEEKALMLPSERILLYHGSKSGITGDIEPRSREQCDFGKGFYLTSIHEQAVRYAERFLRRKKTAWLNTYRLKDNLEGWKVLHLETYNKQSQIEMKADNP